MDVGVNLSGGFRIDSSSSSVTTDTEPLDEQNQVDAPDVKCGKTHPPQCGGKCKDPDKVCVTKFSKKQKKDICKCRKEDAADEDDDTDEEEDSEE